MTTHPTLGLITLAVLAWAQAPPAQAQSTTPLDGSNYFGLSVGQARARLGEDRQSDSVLPAGVTAITTSRNQRDTGYKVYLGHQFTPYLATELGFFKLGASRFGATTTPAGTLTGSTKVQGANLDLVGTLPLTERLSALARVGVQYARTRAEYAGTGAAVISDIRPSERKVNPKLGLGLQYAFSPSVMMRAELERYRINDAVGNSGRINMVSVGLVFPFGGAGSSTQRMAEMPMPMREPMPEPVMAPAPAPVAVAEPVPMVVAQAPAPLPTAPVRQRVSYSAESMFGFDQSTMTAEGKAALDTFARELQGTQFEIIVVEGYTDRLGTTAYNQTLSLQRADAVKSYLVRNGKVDAARITTRGNSESAPVTTMADCPDSAKNARLILCLQPDRRVEVGVSGSR